MKLWAELTMSLQKVETKSNTENDGAFSSRLCKGARTSCHRHPPRHPARRTTSHPEDVTELSQTLRSGAQPASPRDGDMRDLWFGHRRVTEPRATVPRAITQPQGHHPAPRQP